ncbi:multiple sugar transport system permease protein/sn-glycerol 3-phosphate transport system permease protein [Kribbella sp. VKM Ac-2571]|uniref:carbohydrate ABC transporter permease n=1 Tax=Kribbella sp. VKM Ac-2571 TaxID=2512222 RepID=UPI0010F2C10F|nr:carbohydrate ABC transporter permease [Kribbella sp. VKM Ac-2571]TDO63871.1 multiple sugar transport system permease protein/sn-glycerol 3-phosphate transport system permease protein [Kribbella sp. VKM Ac-2571]
MTALPTETTVAGATQSVAPAKKKPRLVGTTAWYVVALFICAVMVVPLLWMITIGLKSRTAVFDIPPKLLPHEWTWSNFINGPKAIHFPKLLLNSFVITGLSVIGGVMTAMMAGYALARLRFPGRKMWFYLFVGSMLLPGVVGLIPLFQMYKSIGWYDTWLPLIVPAFLGGNPLFIFLARQYFLAIPYSIDEAAKIDGAGHLRIFVSVMLPLTRPAWLTMAILAFQASWNDYLNPLVYLYSSGKWPLSVGMASFISPFAGKTPDWSYYMATNLLYMLPPLIIFFAAQRYFIQGLGALGSTTQK